MKYKKDRDFVYETMDSYVMAKEELEANLKTGKIPKVFIRDQNRDVITNEASTEDLSTAMESGEQGEKVAQWSKLSLNLKRFRV